jgi:5-formyltetrahydrofolate cyclo-ligase
MRAKRNAVPSSMRKSVAAKIAGALMRTRLLRRDQRIAVYTAFDGEIDLMPVIRHARRERALLYAPRIVDMRTRSMEFVEFPRHAGMFEQFKGDRRSILWPTGCFRRTIEPRRLDIVLVPLVAFDMHGWRLGFGAGFYDRKFHFLRRGRRRKPTLIGIAYDFQRVPRQHRESWDVLLDGVVTESGFHRCRP